MGLGTGGRTITKVDGVIKDSTITASKFSATGTASSTTVLYGNMAWASGAPSGKRDFTDTNATPSAGDVWFESSQLKFAVSPTNAIGLWITTGNMTRAQEQAPACGNATSGLLAGGENSGYKSQTDLYNGTNWSASGGALATARANSPLIGNAFACIFCGGQGSSTLDSCEEFNGTSWSAGGTLTDDLTSGVSQGFGTLTAGVIAGGSLSGSASAVTQLYNGTAWSTGNNCLATKNYSATAGKNSAGLVTGGSSPAYSTATEEYDGTSWAAGGTLGTGRSQLTGAGYQNGALAFAGTTGSNSLVNETYDGTSWSAANSLVGSRRSAGGNGIPTSAFVAGGYGSGYLSTSEEWTKPGQDVSWNLI